MHRFFFHLHECESAVPDDEGRLLPSFEEAVKEAVVAARGIMASEIAEGHLCMKCHIVIADAYGIHLAKVGFDEAIAILS